MTVKRYRKRPVEIEAMRWTGYNIAKINAWVGDHVQFDDHGHDITPELKLFVKANTAWLHLDVGEWIAKDKLGFYPVKDSVFLESYEPVD